MAGDRTRVERAAAGAGLRSVLHKRDKEALEEMSQAVQTAEQAKQVGRDLYPRYEALLAAGAAFAKKLRELSAAQ